MDKKYLIYNSQRIYKPHTFNRKQHMHKVREVIESIS